MPGSHRATSLAALGSGSAIEAALNPEHHDLLHCRLVLNRRRSRHPKLLAEAGRDALWMPPLHGRDEGAVAITRRSRNSHGRGRAGGARLA